MKTSEMNSMDIWGVGTAIFSAINEQGISRGDLSVSPSNGIDKIFSVKVSDWRTERKWHVSVGSDIVVTFGKREVVRTDDTEEAARAITADMHKLSKRYDERTMKSANQKGDLAPQIINIIKEKVVGKVSTNHYDDMKSITIAAPNVIVKISISGSSIEIHIISYVGITKVALEMSDPSFDPERFTEMLNERIDQMTTIINNTIRQQEETWQENWR